MFSGKIIKNIAIFTSAYKPLTGGAEIYVDELISVLRNLNYLPTVFQLASKEKEKELVNLPRISWLSKPLNFNLMIIKHFFKLLKQQAIIINYPEYFWPVFWHRSAIVISHGAIWTDKKGLKRFLIKAISWLVSKITPKYVFNDSFVLRELGFNLQPGCRFFEEISPGKWFIPNCVDLNKFKRVEPDLALNKRNLILVPRNLTFGRGIDLALEAFALFNKNHPETTLGLVGSPNHLEPQQKQNKYIVYLRKLIDSLSLADKVVFLGHLTHEEMPKVYSSSLMTVIPTRFREGTSLAALESMACKTATLSTAVEGLLDLPTYKSAVNPLALAEAMESVWQERETLAQSQYEAVVNIFNQANWTKAWQKVLKHQ